jgi:hypothetical protein
VAGAGLAATIGEVAATFAQVQRKNERMLYHAAEKKFHTKRQTYAGAHLRRMNNRYAPRVSFINHEERRGGRTKAYIVESIDRHGAFWPFHCGLRNLIEKRG